MGGQAGWLAGGQVSGGLVDCQKNGGGGVGKMVAYIYGRFGT